MNTENYSESIQLTIAVATMLLDNETAQAKSILDDLLHNQCNSVSLNKADETAVFDAEDGSVTINHQGQYFLVFESIDLFIQHRFKGEKVPYKVSNYVGDRDEEGVITWHDKSYTDSEIDKNEDGSCVYTLPTFIPSVTEEVRESLVSYDAFDLLEFILNEPEILSCPNTLGFIRECDRKLKEGA